MIETLKLLILICVSILFILLNTNYLFYEDFVPSKRKIVHGCLEGEALLNPANSIDSLSKGWCIDGDGGAYNNDNDEDDSNFINSNKKCILPYKRLSGSESYNSEEKSWCKIP